MLHVMAFTKIGTPMIQMMTSTMISTSVYSVRFNHNISIIYSDFNNYNISDITIFCGFNNYFIINMI